MLFRLKFAFGFLLLSFLMKAQSTSFGAHLITNYSTFSEPKNPLTEDVFKYVFGYGLGGKVTHRLGNQFSISSEINFERKGSGYDFQFTDENGNPTNENSDFSIHLDYISVPLLVGYEFGKKLKLNLHTGISFHYLANVKSKFEIQIDGNSVAIYNDIKDYHRFDQSVIGGVGLEYPLNEKLGLFINSRFNYGLIETDNNETVTWIWTNKNIAFSILTGVHF